MGIRKRGAESDAMLVVFTSLVALHILLHIHRPAPTERNKIDIAQLRGSNGA